MWCIYIKIVHVFIARVASVLSVLADEVMWRIYGGGSRRVDHSWLEKNSNKQKVFHNSAPDSMHILLISNNVTILHAYFTHRKFGLQTEAQLTSEEMTSHYQR